MKSKKFFVILAIVLVLALALVGCVDDGGNLAGGNTFAEAINYTCEIIGCTDEAHAHNHCGANGCAVIADHSHEDICTQNSCAENGAHTHCEIDNCTQTGIHTHNNCGIDTCTQNGNHSHSCGINGCAQRESHTHGSCGVGGCTQSGNHSRNTRCGSHH